MKKVLCLAVAIALAYAALAACGDDSATSEQPSGGTVTAPTAGSTSPAAVVPTTVPAAKPTTAPAPIATPTPAPTPAPTATASADPASKMNGGINLPADCSPGGMLHDAAAVSSCSAQAMQQVESFSFDGEFNLLAIFSAEGGEEGSIRISGATALPDRLRFEISLGPQGEMIEIKGVVIGGDTYIQDPDSGQWFKGSPPDSEFLAFVQMVGLLHSPDDANAALGESIDLEDGTKGYVLVSEQTGQGSGMGELGLPGGSLTRVVSADDFLTREIRIAVEGMDNEVRDLITIVYSRYNEPHGIEPPEEYVTLPDDSMESGASGAPTIVGFARNEVGDVEVMFSEPVLVQGKVELYVLDPQTGGWGLPFLDGSGTDTLIFDADAEGRPPLIEGNSRIGGITFPTPDSRITDADGDWPIMDFDPWTYQ